MKLVTLRLDWDEKKSRLLKPGKERFMSRKQKISIERIEKEVDAGKEVVDKYFDVGHPRMGQSRTVRRIRKTNLDLTEEMLHELDELADSLNVSRQAVIKVILRQALDQHRLAQQRSVSAKKDKGPGVR